MRRPLTLLLVPLRLAAAAAVTAALYLVMLAGQVALLGARRRRLAWGNRMSRVWCRALARIVGMRVRVDGHPPRPPFLLVSNHQSYVDILLLGGAAGGVFVAKSEIARWPVLGYLGRSVGTVFVDRATKRDLTRVAALVAGGLADGRGIVLFPEGTTGSGPDLLPFKPSLLEVAAAGDLPVHFAVLGYDDPAVPWVGDVHFVRHLLDLLRLPGYEARVRFGDAPVHDRDRKRLSEALRRAMERELDGEDGAGVPLPSAAANR